MVMAAEEFNMALPGLVVTGASGFVGRHVLEAANGKFRLFCLARRSQYEAGIPRMDNQRWTQVDIAHRDALMDVARCINEHGGATTMLHLAGFYDFTYKPNPEYERTNVRGTQNVLDLAAELGVKHFIYSSSLAACRFPDDGESITEDTAPEAGFPYAASKREAEQLIREHPGTFSRSILRFAALYSDWCEYPPVYAFLRTWLSSSWNAAMLGGRGRSAVPYLHIKDLITLIFRVIERAEALPPFAIYNASPSYVTSHLDMYKAATRFLFGAERRAIHIPRVLAIPFIAVRQWVMDALGAPPFERLWMMRYVDRELRVDASRTQQDLEWSPTPRYDLTRRLLILIENMKTHPEIWRQRNEAAFVHAARRPNFILYNRLRRRRDSIVNQVVSTIRAQQARSQRHDYDRMTDETLRLYVALSFEILATAIRTRDRMPVRHYARLLARDRKRQGFDFAQVCMAVDSLREVMRDHMLREPHPDVTAAHVHEFIDLNLQLAIDEIEECFTQDGLSHDFPEGVTPNVNVICCDNEMLKLVEELRDLCQDSWEVVEMFGRFTK
jgi:nucleoside-diphosphate-sugar epimerase